MNPLIKYVSGIDIAKDKFDACLMSVDTELKHTKVSSHTFLNTPAGFKAFLAWTKQYRKGKAPMQTVMEASGIYHERLAFFLADHELPLSVVLPTKARRFLQALGLKSKNDTIDAGGIALMGIQTKLDFWKPASKFFYELRKLTRFYQNTQEMRTVYMNQLHALDHSAYSAGKVQKPLDKRVALYTEQLKQTAKDIVNMIESDQDIARKVSQITQIKGVGILTLATILAETDGFELFSSAAQLVSYAGYDVVENQSGQKAGKTHISKKGNSQIRRAMHMPALTAVRLSEPAFLNLYIRVYDRAKIKMKGYVAVQKKLLTTIYALWKKDVAYEPTYQANTEVNKTPAAQSQVHIPVKVGQETATSGNDELRPSLPLVSERNIPVRKTITEKRIQVKKRKSIKKTPGNNNKVVPPAGSTTQDSPQYNESPKASFPLAQT